MFLLSCVLYPPRNVNILYRNIVSFSYDIGKKKIKVYIANFYKQGIIVSQKYDILYKEGKQAIDNNTLAALTLLIAESNPNEKDVIIDLVMNFLNN